MVKLVILLEDLVYFFVMKRQENNLIKLNKIKKNNNKVSQANEGTKLKKNKNKKNDGVSLLNLL
jgi:hypothetical protein